MIFYLSLFEIIYKSGPIIDRAYSNDKSRCYRVSILPQAIPDAIICLC